MHHCADIGIRLEDLPRTINNLEGWGVSVKKVCAINTAKSRQNCRPRKDDMTPFPLNENRFSFFLFFFFFFEDPLLVGQLCIYPKSDRSLLSVLKVTQCSTSEIEDAPLYNTCSLPIQVMTTGPSPAPSKCKSGWPRITGTFPG